MTHEQYFRRLCQGLLAIGVKPTPTTLNRFLHRHRVRFNSINGREARWRREELTGAGWAKSLHLTRWMPPNGQ